jgi:DNA-binding MarR family transcriptional regulator
VAAEVELQELAEAVYDLLVKLLRQPPRDMSLTARTTLSALNRDGPRRLTELAAMQGITQPSMSALVANLARAGLVERCTDPDDGRVVLVAITAAGAECARDRHQAGADAFIQFVKKLPDDQVASLTAAVPAMQHLYRLYAGEDDATH